MKQFSLDICLKRSKLIYKKKHSKTNITFKLFLDPLQKKNPLTPLTMAGFTGSDQLLAKLNEDRLKMFQENISVFFVIKLNPIVYQFKLPIFFLLKNLLNKKYFKQIESKKILKTIFTLFVFKLFLMNENFLIKNLKNLQSFSRSFLGTFISWDLYSLGEKNNMKYIIRKRKK